MVFLVGELEEGEGAAVGEAEEGVAVHAECAEQHVGLRPGGEEREAEDVFVEGAGGLLVLGEVGRVVQTLGEGGGGSHRGSFFLRAGNLRASVRRVGE
mgnify:CR=1 FL=1